MSSIKELLREAKSELARKEYKDAIKVSQKVIKLQPDNYFANLFLGKSYSIYDDELAKAIEHYRRCIEIESDNQLAWKGLFLVLKEKENHIIPAILNFDQYFELCDQYLAILLKSNASIIDLVNEIKAFKIRRPECEKSFFRHLQPGSSMFERVGRYFMTPLDALKGLIRVIKTEETNAISKILSKERLKLNTNDPNYLIKVNGLAWQVYQNSDLDKLYSQLINIEIDDEQRAQYEEDWLVYRLQILKSMPPDIKHDFADEIKHMVDDMVLVKHKSLVAWKSYFEFADYETLDSINLDNILEFFQRFPKEPLAMILYAWIFSRFSRYDVEQIRSKLFKHQNNSTTEKLKPIPDQSKFDEGVLDSEIGELDALAEDEEEDNYFGLKDDEVMLTLNEEISKAKSSTLGHRIVANYFVLLKEYDVALRYTKSGINLIAHNIKDVGVTLSNTKREFTLNLGTIYTYLEFPKNHGAALNLFDKVLVTDPDNIKAKMGKGTIYIERKQWHDAELFLSEVCEQVPDNLEVLSELGWSESNLGKHQVAISRFEQILTDLQGSDRISLEFRSLTLWRLAKTYIFMSKSLDGSDRDKNLKTAFRLLIQIVKISDTFAQAFSTLGDLYSEYFNDGVRAFKCYQKAFEIDSGDLIAAKFLTEFYSSNRNWKMAALISETLVESERSKNALQNINWPYRIIGIAYLEVQREAESIEWLQSALRIDSADTESWTALGQAYAACGRIEASIKVFNRALELDPDHNYSSYLKALSLSSLGEYGDSIDILKILVTRQPENYAFYTKLATVTTYYANDLYFKGYLMKSISEATNAIDYAHHIVTGLRKHNKELWVNLAKSLQLFINIRSLVDKLPVEQLVNIFQSLEYMDEDDHELNDQVTLNNILASEDEDNVAITCKFLILTNKYALNLSVSESTTRVEKAALWYNLGISELTAYLVFNDAKYRTAAIYCFKQSIEYQSNSPKTWTSYGIATMDVNFRVSQHCFIKATVLAPKEVDSWNNLAVLSLKMGDIEHATELLRRSQSLAPQNFVSWLCLAMISEKEGNLIESVKLFTHAYVLSNGNSKIAQLLFARSTLARHVGCSRDDENIEAIEDMAAVEIALEQYLKRDSDDLFANQLSLIVLERLRNFKSARYSAKKITGIVEARFDKAEDETELTRFAIVKSSLARIELNQGNYELSIESSRLSAGILKDIDSSLFRNDRISNILCQGLSYFFKGDIDETLTKFQELLLVSENSKAVVILVAKVLFEIGRDDTRDIAVQELTDYLENNGSTMTVTLVLAAISILEENTEDLRILLQELMTLPISSRIEDVNRNIPFLIEQISKLLGYAEGQLKADWQKTAFFFPNDFKSWQRLSYRINERLSSNGQNKVTAMQLSHSYLKLGHIRYIQRGLYLCPWDVRLVQGLKDCY